jgi:DNA (cytosine-5)-methyltransferase 1
MECERLNGFLDNWKEGMIERMRYCCMGNVLVVGLIKRLGNRILEIEKEDLEAIKEERQQMSLF